MKAGSILWVAAGLSALTSAAWYFGTRPDANRDFHPPWAVIVYEDGSSSVFGLRLEHSTVAEALPQISGNPELALVARTDETPRLEVYWPDARLSGFAGKLIASTLDTPEDWANTLWNMRRQKRMDDGARKVTLQPQDYASVLNNRIESLVFLPSYNLKADQIEVRFGVPAEKIMGAQAEHWLYPERGIDLAYSAEHKEVIQYVSPRTFEYIREPLHTFVPLEETLKP
jgi:hypothetical protein